MKPEYIGIGNFDTDNYVYTYCKCPLPADYAIKWPRIKDGKPHRYSCICENCGAEVGVISKSYGPEIYKEKDEDKDSFEFVYKMDFMTGNKKYGGGMIFANSNEDALMIAERMRIGIRNRIDEEKEKDNDI